MEPRPDRKPGSGRGALHRNIRLLVEYEGTRYRGWQFQPKERTVMGELHNAVQETLHEQPVIIGAGRTDAGVHANGQVANFFTATTFSPERVADELNARLPHDVNILEAREAPMSFHARHDSLSHTYRFQIATRRTAFFKTTVYWVKEPLRIERMAAAAADLIGSHDFRAFGDVPAGEDSQLRMFEASVRREDFLILVHLRAERFLWKMARRIAGVLIEIGAGRMPEIAVRDRLGNTARSAAALTVPPSGLFLESVEYPEGGVETESGGLSGRSRNRRIPRSDTTRRGPRDRQPRRR